MTKVVLCTGGFDPLHSGHIAYFKSAKKLGDELWVAVNSDEWLTNKKGKYFLNSKERCNIIKHLDMVDKVICQFDDVDGSACGAILKAQALGAKQIIFANGGDRGIKNTPEQITYANDANVEFVFGVGGDDKLNSSSWILSNWKAQKTNRSWGHYYNLYFGKDFVVKELVIAPHSKLSMQRHKYRSETWNIVSGKAHVLMHTSNVDPYDGALISRLCRHNPLNIPAGVWHQGVNDSDEPAHIIEIWKGPSEFLNEQDIERWNDENF